MKIYKQLSNKVVQIYTGIKFHLFETDKVFIYWPDFDKGILLLVFALMILPGHLLWYVLNFHSENRIWLNESYYDGRILTTWYQIFLTCFVLCISLMFKKNKKFRRFMGWFIPLYFGLLLIYSAQTVGLFSPAALGGIINILLIGFVFYQPKVIYSIMVIVAIVFTTMCVFIADGRLPYAPLFSDALNNGTYYRNAFWLQSMAILYLPILVVSALFFELLLRQWRRREKKIEHLSQVDALTNVYNRRYTNHYIEKLDRVGGVPYAMIILDLDFFKHINDHFGHDAGDQVLRTVAKVLKDSVREQDIVGRFGGEEFVIVLPDESLQQVIEIAERCRKNIQDQKITLVDGKTIQVTASFGVAMSNTEVKIDQVMRLADQALYKSKEQGRNRVNYGV